MSSLTDIEKIERLENRIDELEDLLEKKLSEIKGLLILRNDLSQSRMKKEQEKEDMYERIITKMNLVERINSIDLDVAHRFLSEPISKWDLKNKLEELAGINKVSLMILDGEVLYGKKMEPQPPDTRSALEVGREIVEDIQKMMRERGL